jgi:hypothetical protein
VLLKITQAFADAAVNRFLTKHITTIFKNIGPYHYPTHKSAEHIAI